MNTDYLGNPVWVDNATTLDAINDFVGGFLSYENRALNVLTAADNDPDNCLANIYAGMVWMFLEAPEAALHARKYFNAAEASVRYAGSREQQMLGILRAWMDDDVVLLLKLLDLATDEFPHDLVALKLSQYVNFNLGNFPDMLRSALKLQSKNQHISYMHGMSAFAYEQCHLLHDAERAARQALHLQRKEPWAQHALAHVLLTQGRIAEGVTFLEQESANWTDLNSFMYTHIWWHLALFYLSQGRFDEARNIYDQHCWGIAKSYSQDQIGAVSLLARMELAGIDVGERWNELATHLAVRVADTVQPFLTMQYLYGLARAGRAEAASLLDAVRDFSARAPTYAQVAWQQVALPACEGLVSYARGDFDAAAKLLRGALPRMAEIGGSHAQRDLFEQIFLDALRRSGRLIAAQQLLEQRRLNDPGNVPVNRTLVQVYQQLGLPEVAQKILV